MDAITEELKAPQVTHFLGVSFAKDSWKGNQVLRESCHGSFIVFGVARNSLVNKYNLMECNCTIEHMPRISYRVSYRGGKNWGSEFPTAERDHVVQPRRGKKVV
jgi:hypothetical protein